MIMLKIESFLQLMQNLAMFSPVGILTWFLTKRHFQKVELKQATTNVESLITDNVIKNLDVYQRMFEDLDEKLIKAHKRISELEDEIDEISRQYRQLREEYEESNNK